MDDKNQSIKKNYVKKSSSWVFIHAYFVEDWQQTPLLLSLLWDGATFDNLKCMVFFHDLNQNTIASKLIAFRANGLSVF